MSSILRLQNAPFSFPYDCWADVIKYLAFPDILSICTTRRSLYATAEPFLYHKVDLSWNTDKLPATSAAATSNYLYKAKFGIFSAPCQPAFAISSTTMGYLISNVDWDKQSSCFKGVVGQTVGVVQDVQFYNAEDWAQALQGNFFAFAAIFISQLSGLRSLHLDYSFVWMGGYPGQMMMSRAQTRRYN